MTKNNIILANTSPHEDVEVLLRGNVENPTRALLLFHGRGASAENILGLTRKIEVGPDVLVCAPQANGGSWYPLPFTVSRSENEPYLKSALHLVEDLITYCDREYRIGPASVVLAGFSQGACLVSQYAASHPTRYAGICVFSGGLIGADTEIAHDAWTGSLDDTRIYIGCDEDDPFIPAQRVQTTAAVLQSMDASVTSSLYTELGHTIHPEGIAFLADLMQ